MGCNPRALAFESRYLNRGIVSSVQLSDVWTPSSEARPAGTVVPGFEFDAPGNGRGATLGPEPSATGSTSSYIGTGLAIGSDGKSAAR